MKRQIRFILPSVAIILTLLMAACSDSSGPVQDILNGDADDDTSTPVEILEDLGGQDLNAPDNPPPEDVAQVDALDADDTAPEIDAGDLWEDIPDASGDADQETSFPDGSDTDILPDTTTDDTGTDVPDDDASIPDADQPDAVDPDSSTPDVSDPDLTEPDTTGTDVPPTDIGDDNGTIDDTGTTGDNGQDVVIPAWATITNVSPMAAIEQTAFTLNLTGTGFADGMVVRIVGDNALTQGYVAVAGFVTVSDLGTTMTADFDSANGLIRGYYRVEIVNSGTVDDSVSGFRILAAGSQAPSVSSVSPDTAQSGRDRMVVVTGTGFQDGASVVLTGYGESYDCSYVVVSDATTITAVVESGTRDIPVGEYDLWVINPDGLAGKWDRMFNVSSLAPPTILGISPARAGNAADVPLSVTGLDFLENAVITLIGPTGDITLDTVVVTAGTELSAVIPAGLAAGIYPVRVTNPDDQYDTYYFYQVSNNSPGSLTTFETMTEGLNIARWQHGLDAMIDGMGHGFLVVSGGLDSSGIPIDDVEISQVSPNGTPGKWEIPMQTDPVTGQRITNRMNEPRSGAATARVGKTLFVVGGRALPDPDSPAVESIETAKILSSSSAPRVRAPAPGSAGLLPAGRWLYRVSAVTPAGEGLASSSVSYRSDGGTLTISWEPVQNAVGYNVYRCPAANCVYGDEVSIAWMLDPSGRSFTDNGEGTLTPSPSGIDSLATPDDPGALTSTTYEYVVTSIVELGSSEIFESTPGRPHSVVVPGGAGMVSLVFGDVPAAVGYNIYRAQNGGDFTQVATLDAGVTNWTDMLEASSPGITPPQAVRPLPVGSLSLFQYPEDADGNPLLLNLGREGARATFVAMHGYDETDPSALAGVILVLGGRSAFKPLPESIASVETIPFFVDGSVGQPELETVSMITGRSFFGLGNSQNRLENLTFEDDDDDDPVDPDCPDLDDDGYFDKACGGTDCNDANMLINPAAWEDLQNGVDDNCDGLVDVPTQGWGNRSARMSGLFPREGEVAPEPVFLVAMFGNSNVLSSGDTGLMNIEAVEVDLTSGHLIDINDVPTDRFRLQSNSDNGNVHGINIAMYQKFLFSFMGVGLENLGQVPSTLNSQSKRFPYCPIPEVGDPGDASFGCPGYSNWTYSDLAGNKRTSANATVSGGLGYYGLTRAFGYIYLVAGAGSSGISDKTYRVLQ